MKSWKKLPELNFVVLIFVARLRSPYTGNVNFELGTRGAVDENRWNALVSSLA